MVASGPLTTASVKNCSGIYVHLHSGNHRIVRLQGSHYSFYVSQASGPGLFQTSR